MARKNKLVFVPITENSGPRIGKDTIYVFRNVTHLAKDTWSNVLVAYQYVCAIFDKDNEYKIINHKLSLLSNTKLDVDDNFVVVKNKNGDILIYDEYIDMFRSINNDNKYEKMLYKLFK